MHWRQMALGSRRFRAAVYVCASVWALWAGCGRGKEAAPEADRSAIPDPSRVIPVAAAPAEVRDVPVTITATGSFRSPWVSEVAPAVAGRVARTPVDVGDFVRRGDVLVELDDRDARLRLEQAEAAERRAEANLQEARTRLGLTPGAAFNPENVPEVRTARANWQSAAARRKLADAEAQRYQALIATGDVSRSAYQQAQTEAESARAAEEAARRQYETALNTARQGYQAALGAQAALASARAETGIARKALADMVVRAPFAGYLTTRAVSPGEFVATSNSVVTVVQVQPIELDLQMPEATSGQVRLRLEVHARVNAFPDRTFRGTVTAMNPSVNPESRAFVLIATFANPDNALRPGMFAVAEVLLPERERAIFAPRAAIIEEPETAGRQVFVVRNGRAQVRVVQVGETSGDSVRVLSGIEGDEWLAISNLEHLFDGALVEVRDGA